MYGFKSLYDIPGLSCFSGFILNKITSLDKNRNLADKLAKIWQGAEKLVLRKISVDYMAEILGWCHTFCLLIYACHFFSAKILLDSLLDIQLVNWL